MLISPLWYVFLKALRGPWVKSSVYACGRTVSQQPQNLDKRLFPVCIFKCENCRAKQNWCLQNSKRGDIASPIVSSNWCTVIYENTYIHNFKIYKSMYKSKGFKIIIIIINVQEYIPVINELFKDCTGTQKGHQPPSSQDNHLTKHPRCSLNSLDTFGKIKEKHLRTSGNYEQWLAGYEMY